MQLPKAYRSLPRPSSRPKPSYPSDSLFEIYLNFIPLNILSGIPLLISLKIISYLFSRNDSEIFHPEPPFTFEFSECDF
jgi:hypothetical protein